MADWFYRLVRAVGRPAFSHSSSPVILHREHVPAGGAIVAPNHLSPYDIPCLMGAIDRPLDFVSITELCGRPLVGRFFAAMNAFPLDRHRVDAAATRVLLARLRRGRLVVLFPEGRIRPPGESMLLGGALRPTVLRLVRLAEVPLVPCVLLGTGAYAKPRAWLPGRHTRYAVAFGPPLRLSGEEGDAGRVCDAYAALYAEARLASGLSVESSPWRP